MKHKHGRGRGEVVMTVSNDRLERLAAQLHDAAAQAEQVAAQRDRGAWSPTGYRVSDCRVWADRLTEAKPYGGGDLGMLIIGPVAGTLTLPGRVEDVRCARRFVSQLLDGRSCRDCIVLLTSEIVTNSIVHSQSDHGGKVTIVVIDLGSAVRVEVIDDGGDHLPHVAAREGDLADRGRGLLIVQELAVSWGHHRDEFGLTTWFVVSDAPGLRH